MSLMRLWRVGGDCSPSRVARRRCFSTMMPSMSSSRAMSVRSGVMGMDSVASRTLVDILTVGNNQGFSGLIPWWDNRYADHTTPKISLGLGKLQKLPDIFIDIILVIFLHI